MNLLRSNPWRGIATSRVLGALFYSTEALASSPSPSPSLYQRILRAGDRNPRVSIVPVLNQWLDQGRGVQKPELVDFIAQLRKSRRFNHALQISEWMSRQMRHLLSAGDISTRLDLISKVRGLEEADKYFDSLSDSSSLKGIRVYGTLLFCYVDHKSLEKAETLFQRMKELGYAQGVWPYNTMLTLYHKRENCFLGRMDKVLKLMEDDPLVTMGWNGYTFAAYAFLKAGQVDMAFKLLRTAEKLIDNDERKIAYEYLLSSYAATGKVYLRRPNHMYRSLQRMERRMQVYGWFWLKDTIGMVMHQRQWKQ